MARSISSVNERVVEGDGQSPLAEKFIVAVKSETAFPAAYSLAAIRWLRGVVNIIVPDPDYKSYHLDGLEPRAAGFLVADRIMPDESSAPVPGSAHDLICRLLLDDGNGGSLGYLVRETLTDPDCERKLVIRLVPYPNS